ncbi:SRPBCC domain-containing protein [Paraburkholderia sp.]|jgi:uncharacterized protein YndB with AHSA1/START domain|uniref:SRPBCC family protein n=1 Tax=Paraburkholderia sp. TaxID=1926495 RepID=UPI002F42B3E3
MSTKPSLSLRRHIKASPARIFRAWTEPAQILKWIRPADTEMLHAEMDARVDGRFRMLMRGASGEEHDVSGRYLEVVPDARLVFTWAWRSTPERESLVTIDLRPDGEGTLLTLTHEQFFDEAARDRHQQGWNSWLDCLERYFA